MFDIGKMMEIFDCMVTKVAKTIEKSRHGIIFYFL